MTFTYPNPQPAADPLVFGDAITPEVTYAIFTKQFWADEWSENTFFDLLEANWTAAPTIPTATLRYRYGRVLERGATVQSTRERLSNVNGYYVKIVVTCADGDRVWHGFVDHVADAPAGIVTRYVPQPEPDPPLAVLEASGVQTLVCVGIVAALDRAPITRTYFKTSATFSATGSGDYAVAYSPPIFNAVPNDKAARDRFGNVQLPKTRLASVVAVPNFSDDPTPPAANNRDAYRFVFPGLYGVTSTTIANRWSLADVLQYLVCYAAPRNTEFDADPPANEFLPVWILDETLIDPFYTDPIPGWIEPILDCDGLTLKGALDRLLTGGRALGYSVFVDETETPNRVYIEPFSTLDATLAADYTVTHDGIDYEVPTNNRVINITTHADASTAITLQQNASSNYTHIRIVGAPQITVASIAVSDALTQGWAGALETDYAAEIAGLDLTNLRELAEARDIRERPKYRPIGRDYRLRFDWSLFAGADLFEVDAARYLPFGVRFRILGYLPLRDSVDYSATPSADVVTAHEAAKHLYRRNEVYAKTFATDGTLTGKNQCWSIKANRDTLHDLNEPNYTVNANELLHQMAVGVQLEVSGAAQQALASGGGRIAPHVPCLDPDELTLTLAFQSDYSATFFEAGPDVTTIDAVKVKTFDLGERLQQIRVNVDTVVGIDATTDTLKMVPATFMLRDDSATAAQLAALLLRSYTSPRYVLRLTSRRPTATLWPGQFVDAVNPATVLETSVKSVITEVGLSFPVGTDGRVGKPTFRVVTSAGEIDPLQFLPTLRG